MITPAPATGSLNTARSGHTAIAVSERTSPRSRWDEPSRLSGERGTVRLVDRRWAVTGSMAIPRINHQATLLPNGHFLISGGDNSTGALANAEVYNTSTGKWTATSSMTIPRARTRAALLLNGQVLVAAGNNTVGSVNTAELYNPATGNWD